MRAAGKANAEMKKARSRDRAVRAMPAPEANAELQANLDVRRKLSSFQLMSCLFFLTDQMNLLMLQYFNCSGKELQFAAYYFGEIFFTKNNLMEFLLSGIYDTCSKQEERDNHNIRHPNFYPASWMVFVPYSSELKDSI